LFCRPCLRIAARALAIAEAAHRLNALRENWLNPPEWVERVPEVVPGYPDRIIPRPEHAAEIKRRTLTNLYNARPAWLDNAHKALDAAVAAAYEWEDYTPDMAEEEILRRLLALNLGTLPVAPDEAKWNPVRDLGGSQLGLLSWAWLRFRHLAAINAPFFATAFWRFGRRADANRWRSTRADRPGGLRWLAKPGRNGSESALQTDKHRDAPCRDGNGIRPPSAV
jgi:hypothetical protein